VVARIEAEGGRAVIAQANVADAGAVARLFDAAETAFGGIDAVVSNAGVMTVAPSPTPTTQRSIARSPLI
jgi:3-oxoacyl-[acyl-carrier protein] reductase